MRTEFLVDVLSFAKCELVPAVNWSNPDCIRNFRYTIRRTKVVTSLSVQSLGSQIVQVIVCIIIVLLAFWTRGYRKHHQSNTPVVEYIGQSNTPVCSYGNVCAAREWCEATRADYGGHALPFGIKHVQLAFVHAAFHGCYMSCFSGFKSVYKQ